MRIELLSLVDVTRDTLVSFKSSSNSFSMVNPGKTSKNPFAIYFPVFLFLPYCIILLNNICFVFYIFYEISFISCLNDSLIKLWIKESIMSELRIVSIISSSCFIDSIVNTSFRLPL